MSISVGDKKIYYTLHINVVCDWRKHDHVTRDKL